MFSDERREPLLEGEEIICATKDGILLTNDGFIAQFHYHSIKGITPLFRMLHAREINSIKITEIKPNDWAKFGLLCSLLVVGVLIMSSPFSNGFDTFMDGHDQIVCSNGEILDAELYFNDLASCNQEKSFSLYQLAILGFALSPVIMGQIFNRFKLHTSY